LPVLIFSAIVLWAPKPANAPPFEFNNVFPIAVLEPLFYAVCGFALLAFVVGVVRFARGVTCRAANLPGVAADIATHRRFAECGDAGMRIPHLLTFFGFAGLALVGTIAGVGTMLSLLKTPLALTSALKLFANAMAAVALVGVVLLLARRWGKTGTYFDWFFLATLSGVVFTGIASELLRLAHIHAMYGVYFVHLVLIFTLLLYAPYSKFAHLAYRTVALTAIEKSSLKKPGDRHRRPRGANDAPWDAGASPFGKNPGTDSTVARQHGEFHAAQKARLGTVMSVPMRRS